MDIAQFYDGITLLIIDETGASDSLLHVHAGMAILLIARLVTGRSLATAVPLITVFIAAVANEVLDRISHGSWRWADTSLDLLNTLFWPTVLFVGLRARRAREGRRATR